MLGPFRVFAVSIIFALSPAFNYAFLGRAVFLMCFVFTVLISFIFAPRSWACALVHKVGVCARASVCLSLSFSLFLFLSPFFLSRAVCICSPTRLSWPWLGLMSLWVGLSRVGVFA